MKKKQYEVSLPEEVVDIFMREDDLKCQYRLGDEIEKQNSQEGDLNVDGALGTIIGNMFNDYGDGVTMDLYLIMWHDLINLGPIGTIGPKIKLHKNGV